MEIVCQNKSRNILENYNWSCDIKKEKTETIPIIPEIYLALIIILASYGELLLIGLFFVYYVLIILGFMSLKYI